LYFALMRRGQGAGEKLGRLLGPLVPEPPKRAARRVLGRRYHQLFPGWHRDVVGGRWEEVGALQTDFLVEHGLRPEHRLLDVGCGSLRAGVPLIRYLEPGHYFGIDSSAQLLAAGRLEVEQAGLSDKAPVLRCDPRFAVDSFGERFDYALAHSVFTHVPINSILVCLLRVGAALRRPGGRFYATFFENPRGTKRLDELTHPRPDGPAVPTRPDCDPYHHGLDLFEWLCEGTALRVEYLGDWGSPTGQKMLLFTPRDG
jgi:SAM-dependent methyltransferase